MGYISAVIIVMMEIHCVSIQEEYTTRRDANFQAAPGLCLGSPFVYVAPERSLDGARTGDAHTGPVLPESLTKHTRVVWKLLGQANDVEHSLNVFGSADGFGRICRRYRCRLLLRKFKLVVGGAGYFTGSQVKKHGN